MNIEVTVSSSDLSPEPGLLSATPSSSVPPLNPVCSLDCSSCKSILNSNRRMTSPNPLALSYLGQILLRSVVADRNIQLKVFYFTGNHKKISINFSILFTEKMFPLNSSFLRRFQNNKLQIFPFMIVAD